MIWLTGAILLMSLTGQTPLAQAQQDKSIGGHIGFGFPLVTTADGNVTTIADNFQIGLPIGLTVTGSGRTYFDLELVPAIVDSPRRVTFTVNPGILWQLGHGFSAGSRIGFDVNTSQWGITPLVVKSWTIEHSFFRSYFAETDFVFRFNRPLIGHATNPFTFNVVFGVGS